VTEAGVSMPVAFGWFRHAGGVNPCFPPVVSGRYLSFAEREDIAIWHAQGLGAREIARPLGRSPSTLSHELRRLDADLSPQLQGVHRSVARRAPRPAAKGGQTGQQ
jgi:hypothetical protein